MIDLNRYYIAKTYDGVSGAYAGRPGFVPQATTGDAGKFLRADGSWSEMGPEINQVSGNLQSQIDDLSVKSIAYAIALG